MYLQKFNASLSNDTVSLEQSLDILKLAIKAEEIDISDFSQFEKKAKQAKKNKVKPTSPKQPVGKDAIRKLAEDTYGWYREEIAYTTKLVKNSVGEKEWVVSIVNNNNNIAELVNMAEPGIALSTVHQSPFLGDHKTRLEPKQAGNIRSEVETLALGMKFKMSEINEAINKLAYDNEFNPLHEYFESLKSNPALEHLDVLHNWLQLCFGADDLPVIHKIGYRWVIQAAARWDLKPGGVARYNESVLVIQADDGAEGKSLFVQTMPPDPSYTYEGCPKLDNTQSSAQTLIGSGLIDFSEGEAADKHSIETNKRFITSSSDKYVEKFQNFNKIVQRPYVFTMTTNNDTPLHSSDLSIIRRFQVIKVKKFDNKMFLKIRDQLWFEAYRELKKLDSNRQLGDKDPYVLQDCDVDELRSYSQQFVKASILREQLINYFSNLREVDNFYTVDEMQEKCKGWNKFATSQEIRHVMCDDLKFVKRKKDIKIIINGTETILRGHWVYLSSQFALTDQAHTILSKKSTEEHWGDKPKVDNVPLTRAKKVELALTQLPEYIELVKKFMQSEQYKKIMEGEDNGKSNFTQNSSAGSTN